MKIGVTTNNFNASCGGMERQAYDIVAGLVERGAAVTVIAKKANAGMPLAKRLERLVVYGTAWVPGKARDKLFSWRLDRGRERLGLDCLIACNRVENAELTVCGGTHIGHLAARGSGSRIYDRLSIAIERKQFSRACRVAACSNRIRAEILEYYGVDGDKVHTVYPAVDAERFRPCGEARRRELRAGFGFAPDRKIFLFPSYAHVRKGLPFLRRFFEDTKLPAELVVVGRKTDGGRNVRSFGPAADIELLYQAADAVVMAPVYEPFGLAGVESVLCGTPVILADAMGCCEVLESPAAFKMARGDLSALDRAVRMIVDGEIRAGGDLRRFIRYDFERKAYVEALMGLIAELHAPSGETLPGNLRSREVPVQ